MAEQENSQSTAQQLEASHEESQMWKEKFQRLSADFQNFQRRSEKEQGIWMQTAQTDVIRSLLPVVDDIDRALNEAHKHEQAFQMEAWLAGFKMISATIAKLLKKYDVQEITQLTTFDPALHEAVVLVEVAGKQSGDIIEVLEKGYTCKGNVVRPAKVTVAR
jgi:molecular chaperone GrpE